AFSVMRLIPSPPGKIEAGEVCFEGQDLLKLTDEEMRKVRGSKISMIFQEPMTSLNPVYTVGDQISEVLEQHMGMAREEAMGKAVSLLRAVGIPEPERRVRQYPHEMSGGMRQRVMIAMALACDPKLLIADEPTTALDVTIQAQILELMEGLKKRLSTAIILITHNLGVVAQVCDRVMVMYAGRVIETGGVRDIFHHPRHPYTRALLDSIPRTGRKEHARRLPTIEGIVPSLYDLPRGCRFAERCPFKQERCVEIEPGLEPAPPGASDVPKSDGVPGASRMVRCHFPLAHGASGGEVRAPQPGGIGA
ncbi:MAG TPA: ABC transporter ATP-binding protein, partial [Phycisphaerales bacterium]|nr:ABC transporter ATP-binding protein [Phycisphaerales bacterium]